MADILLTTDNYMINDSITKLIKGAPIIGPEDTVRRAAGLIQASGGARILVLTQGQIVGVVTERALAGFLAQSEDTDAALDARITPLIEPDVTFVDARVSLKQAAEVFASNGDDMLPIIDERGIYRGVLYRRDLIALLTKNLRPPTVAGMATPLGVYLTTGSHRAGAGNWGLFLTGVSLALMTVASILIVDWLQRMFSLITRIPMNHMYDLTLYISTALTAGMFLLLLRLSPLSGYHAAEHMTVHAIEAGESLTLDLVRRMPRVHPRCGTNLLAAAGVFLILTTRVNNQLSVLVALVVVVLGWRMVGGWLQSVVTTKHPTDRQLANGVAAGIKLMEHFQEQPDYQAVGWERIWNLGFLQTASGMAMIIYLLTMLRIPALM